MRARWPFTPRSPSRAAGAPSRRHLPPVLAPRGQTQGPSVSLSQANASSRSAHPIAATAMPRAVSSGNAASRHSPWKTGLGGGGRGRRWVMRMSCWGLLFNLGKFECILLGKGRSGEAGKMRRLQSGSRLPVKSHRAERAAVPGDSCRVPVPGGLALPAFQGEASPAPSRLISRGKPDPSRPLLPEPVPVLSAAGTGGTAGGPGAERAAARRGLLDAPGRNRGRGAAGRGCLAVSEGRPAISGTHKSSLGPRVCF